MRLHAVVRIREQARALALKVRRAAVFILVLTVLVVSLVVGKNVLLKEVGAGIHKSFAYDSLKLSYFPPALVIENVRSLADPPALRARRVRIEIPYLSILRNRKVLTVVLESPEVHIRPPAPGARRGKPRPPLSILELPFVIESGRIENGSVFLETGSTTLEAHGVRAFVSQRGADFSIRATAEASSFMSPRRGLTPIGALNVLLTGKGEDVIISRLAVDGPGVALTADGRVRNIFDPAIELDARFDLATDILDDVLRMPFVWTGRLNGEGRLERKDRRLSFTTSVSSDTLAINGLAMGTVRGRFELTPENGGRLELGLQKPGLPAESVSLAFLPGRVEGRVAPAFLDPVFREIKIPWPVRSPAWGTFTLVRGQLEADAEFRDSSLERRGDSFAFRGGVKVGVDFPSHIVTIEAPGLESDFGRLEATARIDLAGDIDARIRGQVADVKETREFVALVLAQTFGFGEIRGQGYADVRLSGRSASPAVAIKATLSPGGFDLFDAKFVETDVVLSGGVFEGRFDVDDPALKGQINVKTSNGDLEVDVKNGDGELAHILPTLGIPVALSGRAAGDFRMIQKSGGVQEFSGTFTSPEIKGYGQTATRVAGRLAWKEGVISFPELAMDFYGGRLEGRVLIGTVHGEFDVDARGEELDFARLIPSASGRLSLSLAGRGVFGRDRLPGLFTIKDLMLSPLNKTEARGELQLGAAGGRINLGLKAQLVPGDNPFDGAFDFPLSGELWSGVVKGRITDLDLIVPWKGAQGRIDYTADIRETAAAARVAVTLDVVAPVMPLPGFAYAMIDFTSAMSYLDGVLTVTAVGGTLGGGPLSGSGKVGIGEGGIASMDMTFEGRDMVLSPMERMRVQADATLRILKDEKRFVTEGEILFKRFDWRREIYEAFNFSSQPASETSAGPSFFDGMSLNIRLRAVENAVVQNSLGRFDVRFNLTATGLFSDPVLLGDMDLVSGDFYFQDRSFRVIHGRLSFVDAVSEPYLDFRGETYVKDFRVTLNMSGPVSRLKPEFTSSPPLPPEEILSLLSLGESFRRTYYSYAGDRSTALNTASLLTYQIADLAKRGAGGLFSLDRFRIDPYIPEGAPGGIAARITVGKKVSKNLLVLYSTILANSSVRSEIDEVPIFRMEWDISRRFSLVGGRDDRGRLGFDVKFRRRF
ncbi:MAG: translocation/assembly module TamB domain-containing protein [Candidatus Aminicenantales bacterium]